MTEFDIGSAVFPDDPELADMLRAQDDGRNLDNPPASSNRSRSYRRGFDIGRREAERKPPTPAVLARHLADEAIAADRRDRMI